MLATYINFKNAAYYLPMLPDELAYEATILIGAQDDEGCACGVLAACEQPFGDENDKCVNLLYLYVHPDYRNNGAGTEMLSLLTEHALNNNLAGIQIQYPASGEKMLLWNFLENKGFETLPDEYGEIEYRFPVHSLKEKLLSQNVKISEKLTFLEDIDKAGRNRLLQYMDDMQSKKNGRNFSVLPLKAYSQSYSSVAFDNDEVVGCAMVTICANGDIELKILVGENAKLLIKLLSEIVKKISSEKGDDAMLRVIPSMAAEKLNAFLTGEDINRTELAYQFISF